RYRSSVRARTYRGLGRPLTLDRGASRAGPDLAPSSGMTSRLGALGRRTVATVLASTLAIAAPFVSGALAQGTTEPIAITHVTVIDAGNPNPRPDQTVILRGNRIASVGASRSTRVPPGARVIDATGKFIVPGFWDMHVHTAIAGGRALLPLYVANGVTGVRD